MKKTFYKSELNDFLSNYPLYKKYKIGNFKRGGEGYGEPAFLNEEIFHCFCNNCNKITDFVLNIPLPQSKYWNSQTEGVIDPLVKKGNKIDYIIHFHGKCNNCGTYCPNFLLHIWTDKPIPDEYENILIYDNQTNKHIIKEDDEISVYIEKVGTYPYLDNQIDNRVKDFLFVKNIELYHKSQICIKYDMGLGAFQYLKQVAESEIILLTNDIAQIDSVYEEIIYEQLDKYKAEKKIQYISKLLLQNLPESFRKSQPEIFHKLNDLICISPESISENEALEIAISIDFHLKLIIYLLYDANHPVVEIRRLQVV